MNISRYLTTSIAVLVAISTGCGRTTGDILPDYSQVPSPTSAQPLTRSAQSIQRTYPRSSKKITKTTSFKKRQKPKALQDTVQNTVQKEPLTLSEPTVEDSVEENNNQLNELEELEELSVTTPPTKTDKNAPYSKRPVIFVPGFMEAIPSVFFYGIKNHLKKNGWENLYYLNNGLVIGSAEKYAQNVKEKIEEVLQETGADKVDIVAHSYGGVYTRYFIKNLDGGDKIEHFISISSPHKGTKLARVGAFLKSARQMSPNSQFLKDLNADDPTPGDICYATIRSNPDMIIWPYDSAVLDGANNHFVGTQDHFSILYSKKTHGIVQKTLSNPCECCRVYG